MAVLAALSLAPQAASAHAGHSHAHRVAAAAAERAPAAQDAAAQITQELTEADPAAPGADGCGGRPCCSSGPCTGCHGFVLIPVPATVPPTQTSIVDPDDAPPQLSAETTRLRRPPKSFV